MRTGSLIHLTLLLGLALSQDPLQVDKQPSAKDISLETLIEQETPNPEQIQPIEKKNELIEDDKRDTKISIEIPVSQVPLAKDEPAVVSDPPAEEHVLLETEPQPEVELSSEETRVDNEPNELNSELSTEESAEETTQENSIVEETPK
ncbi:unnamed protein product [Ambrosiozyma monospora]|uniref:Unnamed protein product n=1 Tax=Ambrosiozyma monospora TaxID=43982 RepID=A0ACB5TLR4_AMBMO|nr:unnamed protein product [Ambrosiozyma monospora]